MAENNYKLVWDATGEHFYETGVKMGVLYPLKVEGSDVPYSKGVVWNGLTAVTESPSGADANDIYADDMKYLELRATETFGATIEAYTYPDEFAECDGSATVAGVTIGQQARKPFGFCYRTILGNDTDRDDFGYKIHLIYNATASPSERSYQTVNDSPEAITFSWEMTTTPVAVTGYKNTSCLIIDSTKVDALNLAALEAVLYGQGATDARLPLPDEVISILGGTTEYDITLNRSNATIVKDSTLTLTATVNPAGTSVTWASSDSTKASVTQGGVVTGVAAGSATITASISDGTNTYSDTCAVTVTAA